MSVHLGTVDDDGFIWTQPRTHFVQLYVATGDAKIAARDARLPDDDDAATLLEHPSVQAAIQALHDQMLRRIHETADTVIARYSNIAEGDVTDYMQIPRAQADGWIRPGDIRLKDLRTMPRHMRQRVKKLKITHTAQGDTNWELELHDAMRANDALVKLLGLDAESNESAKDFAEAVHAFMGELDNLDDHYPDDNG